MIRFLAGWLLATFIVVLFFAVTQVINHVWLWARGDFAGELMFMSILAGVAVHYLTKKHRTDGELGVVFSRVLLAFMLAWTWADFISRWL